MSEVASNVRGEVVARLISVNVGMPTTIEWQGRHVFTGIGKWPVSEPVMARRLNLDGDGQGDTAGHGGEQRAVLVYQAESYDHWRDFLARRDIVAGQLGENLTVTGLPDDEVCIGDRYAIGEAQFEVTQPRVTCFRAGIRIGVPQMASLLVSHRRPGFYLRVIREGRVQAGDDVRLLSRGPDAMTVAEIDALLYLPRPDLGRLRRAAAIPALSPGWKGSFLEMASNPRTTGSDTRPAIGTEPGWSIFTRLAVTQVAREAVDVVSLRLADVAGKPLPPVRAGQFLTVRLPDAPGAPIRSYSISYADQASYRIGVKREQDGLASTWIHDNLRPGSTIEALGPSGNFVLEDGVDGSEQEPDDEAVVLMSAGIGITPVLAMLRHLVERSTRAQVWWLHSARDAAHHPYAEEADRLLARLGNARSRIWYTRESTARAGRIAGRMTADGIAALGIPAAARAYVCGPRAFIEDMTTAVVAAGLSADHVHSELFGAGGAINPGVVDVAVVRPHQPPGEPGTGPLVTFARSGLTTSWADARHETLLELAEACDVPTRWSCRTGVCHICVTRRLSGSAHYVRAPLISPADDEVLICSAQPTSDIVLDM